MEKEPRQEQSDMVDVSENYEAERIAREKLNVLMGENFTQFAVRFMNIDEYKELMQKKVFADGSNVYFPNVRMAESDNVQPPSFKEYLEDCKDKKWDVVIQDETDWSQGAQAVEMYNHLLDLLKEAKEDIKKEGNVKQNYRARVADRMKKILGNEFSDENDYRNNPGKNDDMDLYNFKYDIFFRALYGNNAPGPEVLNSKDDEYADIVKKWIDNPQSVSMREFINAVVKSQKSPHESRQYNLAMILKASTVSKEESNKPWGFINDKASIEEILGVISIMPGKENLLEMIKTSNNANTSSHPVFDNTGLVRFPKN